MNDSPDQTSTILSLAEERLLVSREAVETGSVKVTTHVEERQEHVHLALRKDSVDVRRVSVDLIQDQLPCIRQEGQTTIYPIVEETIIVTKRYHVIEEVHVTRLSTVENVDREVTLRAMHADVQREPPIPTTEGD